MADYKELLRKAVTALPENNGAARRAVYEKARSALVGQLRAIQPPLAAREITQHRLQLEDCIRQVEQEASEAVIQLGREAALATRVATTPVPRPKPEIVEPQPEQPAEEMAPAPVADAVVEVPPITRAKPKPQPEDDVLPMPKMSIEDIIAEAAKASGSQVEPVRSNGTATVSTIVPRPQPKDSEMSGAPGSTRPVRAPKFEPRRDPVPLAAPSVLDRPRVEAVRGNQAVALATPPATAEVEPALSSVREVEVETPQGDAKEAEGAIERAIETLDRAARGEATEHAAETADGAENSFAIADASPTETGFVEPSTSGRTGGGLTIFLVVFAVLLVGVGGAGFWAWREGFVDVDQMFGQAQPAVTETAEVSSDIPMPTLDPAPATEGTTTADATGPGNTAATGTSEPTTALTGLETEDRLEATPQTASTDTAVTLPEIGPDASKSEERLPQDEAPATTPTDDLTASVDPAVLAGSQSLLLEASADGRTGAVPFSGTVEWAEGVDDLGQPTLVGKASIPARNLGIDVTIRKNSDPSLPASHLMEVDFDINDTFIGGSISSLPGVLLKDEELVPGTPLVGASARVVGNSFLFALSASEADAATNRTLLEDRRWMDLAVVYGNGRNAIVTLEKDDDAQALFDKVFTAWNS